MHWGVEKMISAVWNIFLRCFAGTEPVNNCRSANSSGSCFLKVLKCCSAKGLVGARNKTFERGNFFFRSMARRRAMRVLPRPVGKTTSVLLSLAVS